MNHVGDRDLATLAEGWFSRDGSFQGRDKLGASHMTMALRDATIGLDRASARSLGMNEIKMSRGRGCFMKLRVLQENSFVCRWALPSPVDFRTLM